MSRDEDDDEMEEVELPEDLNYRATMLMGEVSAETMQRVRSVVGTATMEAARGALAAFGTRSSFTAAERSFGLNHRAMSPMTGTAFQSATDRVFKGLGLDALGATRFTSAHLGIMGEVRRSAIEAAGMGTFLRGTDLIGSSAMLGVSRTLVGLESSESLRELRRAAREAREARALFSERLAHRSGPSRFEAPRPANRLHEASESTPAVPTLPRVIHPGQDSRSTQIAALVGAIAGIAAEECGAEEEEELRDVLLKRLKRLLPAMFEEVLFHARAPLHHLPGRDTPQTIRAIELIHWAESTSRLVKLQEALRKTLADSFES